MKLSTVSFGLALLLSSCQQQDSTFAQVVPSPSGALWTLHTNSVNQKIARGYKFYQDGRCLYYLLTKEGTWRRYGGGDDEVTNRWLVRRDTLSLNGVASKLLAVKRDTIYLYELVACDTLILVRAK
jgi:hypothetical protein